MSMDQPAPRVGLPAASGPDSRRWRRAASLSRRSIWFAVAVSIAAHLLLGGSLVVWMRPARFKPAPDTQGTVELLMVEQKGSGEPTPASRPNTQQQPPPQPEAKQEPQPPKPPQGPPQPETEQPPQPPAPPVPRVEKADAAPAGRPTTPDDSGEAVPLPAQTPQQEASAEAPPAAPAEAKIDDAKPRETKPETPGPTETAAPPAKQQPALSFNLDGTDSLTSAEVIGQHVIPASPDDRFRNRPPVFPREAELRGERGAVIVVIHVSETGQAAGADVAESSGHTLLDQAAVDAVLKWHFRPALKDGKAVPFDMPMRFIFEGQ
jgi:protein TonB